MNGVPMRFDYSKTINEQLPTFEYYKDRYCSYELEIMKLRKENQELKKQLEEHNLAIENLAYWKGKNESKMKINRLRKENKELKTQLRESSLQIQSLIEEDMSCPSNCNKLRRLKEQQKEFIEWLQANLEALIMCDREFILTNNKKEIKAYSEILSKYKEIVGGSNDQ